MNTSLKNRTVLLVDDDEINAAAFVQRLEKRGFKAKHVSDSLSVMGLLETESFDIVLLDIIMPQLDGLTLLKMIRKKHNQAQLPVIMITSVSDSKEIFSSFEFGANDYITKPLNIEASLARIRGQLSSNDLRRAESRLQEMEAVNALVVTYHHEINNPLAIAYGELQFLSKEVPKISESRVKNIYAAFERIKETLNKISQVTANGKIIYETYAVTSKMIQLKDKGE